MSHSPRGQQGYPGEGTQRVRNHRSATIQEWHHPFPHPVAAPISTHNPHHPHHHHQFQAARQGHTPIAPCGECWSQVRARAGGGCGREDRCNHGSQHHPLGRSLSSAPAITAGRKESRPLGSDALAPGSLLLPLQTHWGQLPLLPSPTGDTRSSP